MRLLIFVLIEIVVASFQLLALPLVNLRVLAL
jgi:hypothetical protein